MRSFTCVCGATVYFDNDTCLNCGRTLGFIAEALEVCPFTDAAPPLRRGVAYRRCRNWEEHECCNWLLPDSGAPGYCESCRLNEMVPDLSQPRRLQLWGDVERAKRHLIYSLIALGLPIVGRDQDPAGLSFRILADQRLDRDDIHAAGADDHVMTGHYLGRITLNLMEADPGLREEMREAMNESYRTVLGHLRHESGHFYFDQLLNPGLIDGFRHWFGDDGQPYQESLDRYYRDGPPAGWQADFVSEYAASHPLEDFADTWAHYLHMVDTLETAHSSNLQIDGQALASPLSETSPQFDLALDPPRVDFDHVLSDWVRLTITMNRLNRSMGLGDAYPFALAPTVVGKLRFVHDLIQSVSQSNLGNRATP